MTPAQQRKFVALWRAEPRLRLVDIAARMGVPLGTVSWQRYNLLALGLIEKRTDSGRPVAPTAGQLDRLARIVAWREAGLGWVDIGAALGVTKQAAHRFAHHHAPEAFAK